MKREGNLYQKVIHPDNLRLADLKARRGKQHTYGVKVFDRDPEGNIMKLHAMLARKEYRTSEYHIFSLVTDGGKTREIYRLPYFPDRIVHHAVMNILKEIWIKIFSRDTYSCIEGRGIHSCANKLKTDLRKDPDGTKYCLKLDVKKFYPSIDHKIMKQIIRKKIKCPDAIDLLDEIIDSAPGLPIGNYLSQYLGNLYLTYMDHWLKEKMGVKYLYRYCDDIVILDKSKNFLHELRAEITRYLNEYLKLEVKGNYQVFEVEVRGIDFVGYRFFRWFTLMRKSIKRSLARKAARLRKKKLDAKEMKHAMASHTGWAGHCNSKNLLKKLNIM